MLFSISFIIAYRLKIIVPPQTRVGRGRGFLKKPRPRITEAEKAEIEVEGQILAEVRGRGSRITEVFNNFYITSKFK